MRYASVVLDIPTQSLDSAYTYALPDECGDAQVGCAVVVDFGRRRAIGFIVGITDEPSVDFDPSRIKPIRNVASSAYFDEDGAACATFLSQRYLAPLSACIRLFTPPGGIPRVVREGKGWRVDQPVIGEVDDRWVKLGPQADTFTPRSSAAKQIAIIEALRAGELRVAELRAEFGSVASTLKTLEHKGVVVSEHRRRMRGVEKRNADFIPSPKPILTQGQSSALKVIGEAIASDAPRVVVVDGVTGSGKTEVYLQAIEQVLDQGKTAIVLVPEISLTPQTVGRFRGRFGDTVAVMHSRMSAGERYDQWDFIRSGAARVVVGARSALFTPMPDVGIIIIDEEHETSYKQDSAPRYVSRDVAEWMVQRRGACLVLGSATPSVEALKRVDDDPAWSKVELLHRANGKPMPQITVVDMAREFGGGSRSMFAKELQRSLEAELRAGHKAVLLLNQRGFAKFLLCRDCGFVPECPSCSTSLTFHEYGNKLVCHHCGYTVDAPARCPECGSPYLKKFGAGTQRVEAELRALIDTFEGVDAKIVRMDADTTKNSKTAHRDLLDEFASAQAAVLLGTQMIAKGLDFDDVTLVGVIDADTQLRLPDFRSAERTFDLIEQVAGRAGRADLPGRVLVQTYSADSVAIQAAAHYDRASFLKDDLPKRELLKYPPYVRMADILIWGAVEAEVRAAATMMAGDLMRLVKDRHPDWVLLPATPCILSRLKGKYRYHITIKAPGDCSIADAITPYFRARKADPTVNVAVDIDPVSLL